MKKLVVSLAAVLALSLVSVAAASATPSMGSIALPVQATPASLLAGTTFGVQTAPITHSPDGSTGWQDNLNNAEGMFYLNGPGPLEAYTIACWSLAADVTGPNLYWKCGAFHSNPFGPNASENAVAAQFADGSLSTTDYNECSWVLPVAATGACGAQVGNPVYTPGSASPLMSGNMMPNLDPYVGKTVNLYADENWCTYLAPPNYDITSGVAALYNGTMPYPISTGCYGNSDSLGITLDSRLLADASQPPVVEKVKLTIKAGPRDCHVPKVKGLSLRKAKARLHRANCRASVKYVRGRLVGHVRYQPLPVGTGRPRGFRVKLAVVR